MPSVDGLNVRHLSRQGRVIQKGTDEPIAIRVRHLGSETVTSVTVTTGTSLVMVGSGTTDTILFATDTTIGAVADRLNATGRWEAKVVDVLRSKLSTSTLLDGAITASTDGNGVVIWDVLADTSTFLQISVGLTPSRDFDAPSAKRCGVQEIKYGVNMGTAAADSFQVWLRRGKIETKIFGALSVDTTETTVSFASGLAEISGRDGDEFIVLVKDAATLADASSNYVRVSGWVE